jgi:hypothetical protein
LAMPLSAAASRAAGLAELVVRMAGLEENRCAV